MELYPDDPFLSSLSFTGNRAFDDGALEAGLATDTGSWVPFTHKPRFDAATFQGDVDRLTTFYKAHGYFDARVIDTQVTPHGKDAIDVRVRIEEGQPYLTRALAISGIDALPPELRAEIARPLPLRVGEVFTEDAYQKAKAELRERVRQRSYAAAAVEGRASVDPAGHAVDVTFNVTAGGRYRYGAFDVIGNHRVSDARILGEIESVLAPGGEYRESDLEEARARLHDLGVFGNVEILTGAPDPTSGTLPVVISVAEAPFQSFRAGGGIGFDVEHEEAHVSAGYTDRDFLGHLRRLDFDNSFALEWLPNVIQPVFGAGQPAFLSTLKLTQPDFFGRGLDLEASLQGQREVEIGYVDYAVRGRLGVPMRLLKNLTFTPAYNAEVTFFEGSFNGLSLSPAALLSLGNPDQSVFVLSYLEEALTWDLRDDPIEPTYGLFTKLTLQETVFGSFDDVRVLPEARGYLPLGSHDVLALRLEAGALFTYAGSQSAIDQRFFLGGLDSVRGYGSLRLSPMVRVNTCGPLVSGKSLCTTAGNSIGIVDIPVGGNGMLEGSLELRHTLSDLFSAVAFVDVGEVTESAFGADFSFGNLSVTPGIGLRIRTPLGPIRLDVAYLLVDPAREVSVVDQTFGQQASGYYPIPSTAGGAVDTCGWPFVPQNGWGGTSTTGQAIPFAQPSSCKSQFLDHLALSIAIGEAF